MRSLVLIFACSALLVAIVAPSLASEPTSLSPSQSVEPQSASESEKLSSVPTLAQVKEALNKAKHLSEEEKKVQSGETELVPESVKTLSEMADLFAARRKARIDAIPEHIKERGTLKANLEADEQSAQSAAGPVKEEVASWLPEYLNLALSAASASYQDDGIRFDSATGTLYNCPGVKFDKSWESIFGDVRVLMLANTERRLLVIAYRGTATAANLATDALFLPSKWETPVLEQTDRVVEDVDAFGFRLDDGTRFKGGNRLHCGNVHSGFRQVTEEGWRTITEKAHELMDHGNYWQSLNTRPEDRWTVLLTGHSLGAATATMALPFMGTAFPLLDLKAIVFATPKVGDRAFEMCLRVQGLDDKYVRVAIGSDPITHIPPVFTYTVGNKLPLKCPTTANPFCHGMALYARALNKQAPELLFGESNVCRALPDGVTREELPVKPSRVYKSQMVKKGTIYARSAKGNCKRTKTLSPCGSAAACKPDPKKGCDGECACMKGLISRCRCVAPADARTTFVLSPQSPRLGHETDPIKRLEEEKAKEEEKPSEETETEAVTDSDKGDEAVVVE